MADRIAVGAYPDIAAWQSDADNYVSGFDSLSGLGWMDESFRFTQASPAELLPMVADVGPDFNPVRKETLLRAAETQEISVSAPFAFGVTQAQVSMIAPIVRDGQTIGLLGNALNLEALFSEISREVGDAFAYTVTEGDTLVYAKGAAQDFEAQSVIHAANREWSLTVPISGAALVDAYVWGQRFAFTRILAFIVIVFAVERARLAQSKNQKLQARNSDLVAAQTIMESQEAEISLMRSSLAHDLKSPIRNVRIVTTMWDQLKEAKGLTDQDLKDRILDNLTRLEKLSLSFTDFLSARVALVQKEPMALTDFLHEVERRFADRCRINVQTDGPMVIETDRLLLARVFDNLVENAINASEDGNVQITVSVTEAAGLYSIHFRDNGRGIPAALRERIFKPFDTGDGKRRPDSSGLGLTIVRRLIGNLDGTVTCVDPGGQGGAVFVIELPKA
jgi:signal transduction histidine kinase